VSVRPLVSYSDFKDAVLQAIKTNAETKLVDKSENLISGEASYRIATACAANDFKEARFGKRARGLNSWWLEWITQLQSEFGDRWRVIKTITTSKVSELKSKGEGSSEYAFAIHYRLHAELKHGEYAAEIDQQLFGRSYERKFGEPIFEAVDDKSQPRLEDPGIDQQLEEDDQILHYAYCGEKRIQIIGRGSEQSQLYEFLNATQPFLWLQVAGAAGQGKSRLAWELIQEARGDLGFSAGFMAASELGEFSSFWGQWQPSKPTLIVIDYVAQTTNLVGPLMAVLMRRSSEFDHKVRLLLLERQRWDCGAIENIGNLGKQFSLVGRQRPETVNPGGPSFERTQTIEKDFSLASGRASWFDALRTERDLYFLSRADQRNFRKIDLTAKAFRFGERGVVELRALANEDLVKLVRRVVELETSETCFYSDAMIEHALCHFDSSGRPLYAYFLGLALSDGRFSSAWSRSDLLNYVLGSYAEKRWSVAFDDTVPSIHDDSPSLHLAVAATILRTLSISERAGFPCVTGIGERHIRQALTLVGAPIGSGYQGLGKVIPGLLPDLLGEWFVLTALEAQADRRDALLDWCWRYAPKAVVEFLLRIAWDFPNEEMTNFMLSREPPAGDAAAREALVSAAAGIVRALISAKRPCPPPIAEALVWSARQGQPDALNTLGVCYHLGYTTERSDKQAFDCFKKASEKGHAGARMNLGLWGSRRCQSCIQVFLGVSGCGYPAKLCASWKLP
jgi:hypothetical protein